MNTFSLTTRKIILAYFIGPLAVVPATVVFLIATLLSFSSSMSDLGGVLGISLVFSVLISYAAALVVGVPSLLLLHKIGQLNYYTVLMCASAVVAGYVLYIQSGFYSYLLLLYFSTIVAAAMLYCFKLGK